MKKRFSEAQIIGFLREAEAGLPVKQLCRRHGFSEASYYLWRNKFGGMTVSDAKTPEGADRREHTAEEAAGRVRAGKRGDGATRCEKSGDRPSPTGAGAGYDLAGGERTASARAGAHECLVAAIHPGAGYQRRVAGPHRGLGAPAPPLRCRDDLPQVAAGGSTGQPQAGGAPVYRGQAAGTSAATQEDPGGGPPAPDTTPGAERGLVCRLRLRPHGRWTGGEVPDGRR